MKRIKYKFTKDEKKYLVLNPKLSKAKFNNDELRMIKEIKNKGYEILFSKNNTGADLVEPYKSLITGKIMWNKTCFASTITQWDKNTYPLKEWFDNFVK